MVTRIKLVLESDGTTDVAFEAIVKHDYDGGQHWVLDPETECGGHGDTNMEAALNYLKYRLCPGIKL